MRIFLYTISTIILLIACKKQDEKIIDREKAEFWINLADQKRVEIHKLRNDYTCADLSLLTIQSISERYICKEFLFIHKRDLNQFQKLKKEYENYVLKSWNAGGVPVTYQACAPEDIQRNIQCVDNKPTIVYQKD